jgi:hypothetical protein
VYDPKAIVQAAFEFCGSNQPDLPLAHYTRIGTLGYFLEKKEAAWTSAWATPVQFLNDRKELDLGLEILRTFAADIATDSPLHPVVRSHDIIDVWTVTHLAATTSCSASGDFLKPAT